MSILVVENEPTSAKMLQSILEKAGYRVAVSENGVEALSQLESHPFDAVITDWMMPEMDGIKLIREIRKRPQWTPFVLMVTSLTGSSAESFAIDSGADDFIRKPIRANNILEQLRSGLARRSLGMSDLTPPPPPAPTPVAPPTPIGGASSEPGVVAGAFAAIGVAASTGGPPTLAEIVGQIPVDFAGSLFIALHGPAWMLETYAKRLSQECALPVKLASSMLRVEPGRIYIAPGDYHFVVETNPLRCDLRQTPPVNFVRPFRRPALRVACPCLRGGHDRHRADWFGSRRSAWCGGGTEGRRDRTRSGSE